jgi:recombination protein RecA
MKIGVMFGSPETTTGGNALKFYASQRLDIRRIGAIKENSKDKKGEMVVVGNRTRVKVVKNKMAPPFREAEFDILYGKGVSRSGEVVDMAVDLNFIQKNGAWYSVGPERIGQGRDNARVYLEEHPEMMSKLEAQILAHYEIKSEIGKPASAPATAGSPSASSAATSSAATSSAAGAGSSASSKAAASSADDDDDDSDESESAGSKAKNGKVNVTARPAAVAAGAGGGKRPGARAN